MEKIVLLIAVIFLPSCVMPPPELPRPEMQPKASALTPGMVKKHLIVKKTTQAEILEMFGPPDMVTKSGSGEMWGYDKVSREVAQAAVGSGSTIGAGGLGLVGGGAGGALGGILGGIGGTYGQSAQQSRRTESTTTFFMLIYFDDKNVVTDYKLSATKF